MLKLLILFLVVSTSNIVNAQVEEKSIYIFMSNVVFKVDSRVGAVVISNIQNDVEAVYAKNQFNKSIFTLGTDSSDHGTVWINNSNGVTKALISAGTAYKTFFMNPVGINTVSPASGIELDVNGDTRTGSLQIGPSNFVMRSGSYNATSNGVYFVDVDTTNWIIWAKP